MREDTPGKIRMSEAVRKPNRRLDYNRALNLRPCPAELRDSLRALAQAHGQELYQYVLQVLRRHVQERRRSAQDHASA